ncbi:MAG: 2-isopropylmalate synthase, partial [Verrucomicrobiaceae bacterium]|nr:2-isopropylmalate synthase [Verrucomicrobiaceae bacterium]
DPEYSLKTVKAASDAGADLVVLCETNGGALPEWVEEVTRKVVAYLGKPVGIHTHNDGGVGVANALAAVRAGANQVQGTINGYGERVGNCNLITVMPNLQIKMGIDLGIDLTKLRDLAHFVDELANVQHDIRAPYVGIAAFTHKGGLHVHAVQKLARTYEHVDPELVGNERIISISDMSGQSNVLVRAEALGFKFAKGAPEVQAVLAEVKRLESEGYEFEAAEASFEMLIRKQLQQYTRSFELIEYHSSHRRRGGPEGFETCEATIKLKVDNQQVYTVDEGDGPVNALDNALRKALTPHFPALANMSLADYKVRIIDSGTGTAAKTRVLVVSTDGTRTWGTVGVSTNIIDASWEALVDSIDYYLLQQDKAQ